MHIDDIKKIIHIDMDCFFAAVEIRDNPTLINKAVAVCNSNERSGAICTSNYIARTYGVRSAMSVKNALKLCPSLTIIPANIDKYKKVSKQINDIFSFYTSAVERVSLDEAYLDVTMSKNYNNSATLIAKEIQRQIKDDLNLSASAGVSFNKLLAKIASDWHKPGGIKVIKPEQAQEFIKSLKIEKLPGVGTVTANKLHQLDIKYCRDILSFENTKLIKIFGLLGKKMIDFSKAIDIREVKTNIINKSVSIERTYGHDINEQELANIMELLLDNLKYKMNGFKNQVVSKQFVKIRFNDFMTIKREHKVNNFDVIMFNTLKNEIITCKNCPIRLVGVGVGFSQVFHDESLQIKLF